MTSSLSRLVLALSIAFLLPGAALGSTEPDGTTQAEPAADALPALERALDVARARHGSSSVELVPALTELAQAYRLRGRADHAEPLYRQAVDLDDRRGGDEARLATNLASLALVYRAQGRHADAEPLYERALPLLERTLGPEHPEVARCLTNRAVLYWHDGRPEKALPLQRRALAIAEKAFGADHPKTAALRRNLELMRSPPPAVVAEAETDPPAPTAAPRVAQPPAAPVPKPPPPPSGRFAIEVGTVAHPAEAPTAWRRLVQRHARLAGLEPRPPWPVQLPDHRLTHRIVAGSFATEAQARAACADLHADGGRCRVLTP